ncbi:MAG: hypothetical protein ACE5G0_10090, partial [Rhodothermales bacterium]
MPAYANDAPPLCKDSTQTHLTLDRKPFTNFMMSLQSFVEETHDSQTTEITSAATKDVASTFFFVRNNR